MAPGSPPQRERTVLILPRRGGLKAASARLPLLEGQPIQIRFLPELSVSRGKLLSGSERGRAVHAATCIRRRQTVLDAALRTDPAELGRILAHELYHFGWLRLGNAVRRSYEEVLGLEFLRGVPGELGWSAELAKQQLGKADCLRRSRRWREYVCESFCDTGAWVWSRAKRHEEHTLPSVHRAVRRIWFRRNRLIQRLLV
jgi:hypothetical protein